MTASHQIIALPVKWNYFVTFTAKVAISGNTYNKAMSPHY